MGQSPKGTDNREQLQTGLMTTNSKDFETSQLMR